VTPDTSTWETIQSKILQPSCASQCHREGTSFARQSDLILTADVAYAQLAGVAPHNDAARSDGIIRVRIGSGTDASASYLWEKINAPEQDHFYADHPGYGSIMPLGGEPLTYGELEYVRQWLQAGAPETGEVAERNVLSNIERYSNESFTPLTQPASGYAIRLGPYDVPAQFEREFFYYEPPVSTEDIFVDRIELSMRPGSHHFILYTLNPRIPGSLFPAEHTYRDIRNTDGTVNFSTIQTMAYQIFFAGSQWPRMDYRFPPGIALRLPANTGFDLNSHSVNRTDSSRPGEVHINLHTTDPANLDHVAEVLELNNLEIFLPAGKTTTVSKSFIFSQRSYIFQLFSHAHERMTEFRVVVEGGPRNGETVYLTFDWEHPPILELNPPLVLDPGQKLRLETTYNNTTDRDLTFGLLSTDEMMILFGYYYTD